MPPTIDNPEEELLAVRRAFQTAHALDDQWLRYDVFRTRCTVSEKVCSLIIDADMKENVVSARVIEKLHLPTWRHPQPYFLYGLKKKGAIKIDQMCLMDFSIGNRLHEQVWCDVVPMDTCHILLGQPWQLDRKAVCDEFKKTYSFTKEKKKIILLSIRAEATTEPLAREITVPEEEERPHIPEYPHVQNDNPPTELPKEEALPNMPPKEETDGTGTPLPQPPTKEISWVLSENETMDMVLPPEPLKTGVQLLLGYNSQSQIEYKYLPTLAVPKVDPGWVKVKNKKVSLASLSKLRCKTSVSTTSQGETAVLFVMKTSPPPRENDRVGQTRGAQRVGPAH